MLVHPVRHHRRDQVLLPPVRGAHLLDPGGGDVPVVVHVVVVEDHGRGDRREQPADHRLPPALAVEARVLLVVEDAVAGRLLGVAARLGEGGGAGRDLVGVDLVAEQEQQVRPLPPGQVAHPQREQAQRVDLASAVVVVLAERPRRIVRRGHAAGAERDPQRALGRERAEAARRQVRSRLGPGPRAVEMDLVRVVGPALEALGVEQRVVVPVDAERASARAEHAHLARSVRLHPHHRVGLADVAQKGSEQQLRHPPGTYPGTAEAR